MMLEHFKGDEIFVKKILDYQNQAYNHQRMILTPFLNPHEQDVVHKIIGHHDLQVKSYGGFINAESQRMIICPDFYELENDDFEIIVVEVVYNQQFGKLQHKDVLGALMNLGIKRECIGDIYDSSHIYFTCTSQTYPYIQSHLKQIKKSKVKLREVTEKIESEAIRAGFVKVNHKEVEEVSFLCHNNDMISFKRHGRVKIVDEERTTKQGNFVVKGYFYK